MPIEFEVTITAKDLYRFNMRQTYTRFSGWLSVAIAVIIFVAAGLNADRLSPVYLALYVILAVLFLIYYPVSSWMRAMRSMTSTAAYKKPLHFSVDESGYTVSQGEGDEYQEAKLPWDQVYRLLALPDRILVYSSRIYAYIIPRGQLGDADAALCEMAEKQLPKYRVKIRPARK